MLGRRARPETGRAIGRNQAARNASQGLGTRSCQGAYAELRAALAGLGVALLPMAVTIPYIKAGELVQVLPDYGRHGGTITAVFPANRHQPAALRVLLDFLVTRMASAGSRNLEEPVKPCAQSGLLAISR